MKKPPEEQKMTNTGSTFKKNEQNQYDLLTSYQSDLGNEQKDEKNGMKLDEMNLRR